MCAFWIKWEKGLTRKPEILQIAAHLKIPASQAAGALMLVMEWLDDNIGEYSHDGHARVTLKSLTVGVIDVIAGVTSFGEAMLEVGWVRLEGGTLVFVNAGRHNGKTAKTRLLANNRKKRERSRSCHDNVTLQAGHPLILSDLSVGIGDPGKGETEPDEKTVIPLLLSTEEFRTAWTAWLKHCREKKKALKPGSQAEKMALKKLEEWGDKRAISAIYHSIASNYQGIFEPKDTPHAHDRPSNSRQFAGADNYSDIKEKL